jgi:hypothetical protein
VGWKNPVKLASPMMASTVAVGTPAVQLLAVLHAVLVVPFQLVWQNAVNGRIARAAATIKWNSLFFSMRIS